MGFFLNQAVLGGSAALEGVMMKAADAWALAVRLPNGQIHVERHQEMALTKKYPWARLPLIRGAVALWDALSISYKSLARSGELAGAEDEKVSGAAMYGTLAVSLLIGLALFVWLPARLAGLLIDEERFRFVFYMLAAFFELVVLVGYLVFIGRMKDMQRFFMYHGAEHKTITAHEKGLELTVENVRPQPSYHPRCGTSFIAFTAVVGGTLTAARMISTGKAKEVLQLGGGLHHAQKDLASGFCIYNDLSVAIRHLTDQGLRVAYLDIDVHHGDGVQWIHYDEPGVLTFSIHESGRYLYPGTGYIHEIGKAEGTGRKLNIPLEPFTEDDSYLEVLQMGLEPALRWFRPDAMVIQCGADAHYLDPLAEILLTTRVYTKIFPLLRQYVADFSGGNAVYTLGGGYSLDATSRIWAILYLTLQDLPLPDHLPEPWLRRWGTQLGHLLTHTLLDPEGSYSEIPRKPEIERRNRHVTERMLEAVRPYWN